MLTEGTESKTGKRKFIIKRLDNMNPSQLSLW